MNIVDRQAIEDLFTRLKEAERNGGPRDPEAEELIAKLVQRQPAAAYYLAQTVLVQQWALNAAHNDIERMERQGNSGGGLLASLFGGGRRSAPRASRRPAQPEMPAGIGFLAGASQTALGVAGGFILIDILANHNFSDSAFAEGLGPDAATDFGSSDFGGGDFGGGGDGGGGGE
jgi:hypothetical protein